jgi:hypothetical protein
MRDSAPTLGPRPIGPLGARRMEIRDESHRGAGNPRGKGGTDAGCGADCVLYTAGVYTASRGGRLARGAGCYFWLEEGSVNIVGDL